MATIQEMKAQIEAVMCSPVAVMTRYSRPGFDARYAQVDDFTKRVTILFDAADDEAAVSGLLECVRKEYPKRFALLQNADDNDRAIWAAIFEHNHRAAGFRQAADLLQAGA